MKSTSAEYKAENNPRFNDRSRLDVVFAGYAREEAQSSGYPSHTPVKEEITDDEFSEVQGHRGSVRREGLKLSDLLSEVVIEKFREYSKKTLIKVNNYFATIDAVKFSGH